MKPISYRSKQKAVRMTPWAYDRLANLAERLRQEIESHPERYPAYAGRRLTLSDVVVLLVERYGEV